MDFLELGNTLALLRKENGVSQAEMAKDLEISRATISAFENGKSGDIGVRKVLQMLDYLGYEMRFKPKSRFPTFEELRDAR